MMDTQADPVLAVAFNKAVDDFADPLKNFAFRLVKDPGLAEDVSQETFLALYRHLHAVPVQAFKPWLFRVARNLCLDHLRRLKHKQVLFRDLSGEDDQPILPAERGSERPDETAQQHEMQHAVELAIQELPAKFKEVFLMCELEGLSYEEVSTALGIPVKTVSTRLFRARVRFKRMIDKHLRVAS